MSKRSICYIKLIAERPIANLKFEWFADIFRFKSVDSFCLKFMNSSLKKPMTVELKIEKKIKIKATVPSPPNIVL
jgi:hypothetical protein